MARIEVVPKVYNNPDTGEKVDYERLVITGSMDGISHSLELKLEKSELLLAKILLASKEETVSSTRAASEAELSEFLANKSKLSDDDKFKLDREE